MSELTPVAPRERLVTLDVLRGFALAGVMIGNMILYSGQWANLRSPDPTTLDAIADWFLTIFVRSKAQTLLTLLFGFGFAVQLLRAQERGEPVMGLYVRRLLVLFAFGALHVALLWWGDVMWGYAISGFGLLLFLRMSDRWRVAWAVGLIVVPHLVVIALPDARAAATGLFLEPSEFGVSTARMAVKIQTAGFAELPWEHLRYALVWSTNAFTWYFFWTLGRFLLGYVAGKRRWFDRDGADHLPVFKRMAAWGGAIAALTIAVSLLNMTGVGLIAQGLWGRLVFGVVTETGLLAMTLAYVGVTVLLMQRRTWRRILGVLAPAGRMPLTTYFSQSLVCTFLFYDWGLGWAGSVGTADTLGLSVAIFSLQVAFAHLWLRSFRFGPLEWVWRSAVYMKRQPMRTL